MKKLKLLFTLPLIMAMGMVLNSCTKGADEPTEVNTEMVNENAFSDTTTEFDFDLGMSVLSDNNSLGRSSISTSNIVPACATVTATTGPNNTFPKTFVVDFGSTGCTGLGGVTRRGKLIINLSKPWYQSGAVMIINRDNYYVNDFKLEGKITFSNQTITGQDPTWTRQIQNGKVTKPDGTYFQFHGIRSISQIEGVGSPALADNVYKVFEGSHHIQRSNGNVLDVSILEPLIKKVSCNYISNGVVQLTGSNINGKLNYGNGTCDNQAVFTDANGVAHTITL